VTRIGLGTVFGGALGIVVGMIWGAVAYRVGSVAMWVVVLACTIFLAILGAFIGGLAGLESPDPGREPTQTDDPLAEPRDLSSPERGGRPSR
jgi:hypothetical protein